MNAYGWQNLKNKTNFMHQNKDKHLDIPAEANTEKHINFLEAEESASAGVSPDDDRAGHTKDDEQRRKEWQQGLAEGERERERTKQE
jgi:hypothetical protein